MKSFTVSSVLQSVNEKNSNTNNNITEDKKELSTSHIETNVQEYKKQLDNKLKSSKVITVNNNAKQSNSKCGNGDDNDTVA